ncbi:MAG: hypothetical protein HQL31_02640 [Planctomycetes bacterium]|nr:hypothetical protein [Planctomycetota bacterium]
MSYHAGRIVGLIRGFLAGSMALPDPGLQDALASAKQEIRRLLLLKGELEQRLKSWDQKMLDKEAHIKSLEEKMRSTTVSYNAVKLEISALKHAHTALQKRVFENSLGQTQAFPQDR